MYYIDFFQLNSTEMWRAFNSNIEAWALNKRIRIGAGRQRLAYNEMFSGTPNVHGMTRAQEPDWVWEEASQHMRGSAIHLIVDGMPILWFDGGNIWTYPASVVGSRFTSYQKRIYRRVARLFLEQGVRIRHIDPQPMPMRFRRNDRVRITRDPWDGPALFGTVESARRGVYTVRFANGGSANLQEHEVEASAPTPNRVLVSA